MARLIKFLILFVAIVVTCVAGAWFYVTYKVSDELNTKYAKKPIAIKGMDKKDYFLSFESANSAGFPYKISWELNGWLEESRTSKIRYHSPIHFGYDLLLQKLFIRYSGDITAAYKPESHNFGSKLKVEDYSIEVDLPLSKELIMSLKNLKDPFEMINYIGDIRAYTGSVDIFDLEKNEKFYDKDYEKLEVSFVPQKRYKNAEDFLNNIPQHLMAKYSVKTNPNSSQTRRLPVSLFYGFSMLPSGFNIDSDIDLKTKGNNLKEIERGLEVKISGKGLSDVIDFSDLKLEYISGTSLVNKDYKMKTSSKMFFKVGMFDELFARYNALLSPKLRTSPVGAIIDKEVKYVIANKEAFKFNELENRKYNYNLDVSSARGNNSNNIHINDLSVFSESSGFKLKHEMERSIADPKNWSVNGVLLIENYPAVVEFSSGYIYRFGKFKHLKDEARELYVEVNKAFLKDVSDYPKSKSNDLSFEYSANSNKLKKTKLGTVRFDQIPQLYTIALYQKLLNKVGHGGDVLSRMQEIIPGIDANEPILKKILPKISGDHNIGKSLEKKLDKAIPKKTQDVIKKALPKNLQNKMLKGLFK